METDPDVDSWSKNDWDRFYKAEENYLKTQSTYIANKLKHDYGTEELSILASRGGTRIMNDGEKAVQAIIDEWTLHAY